MNRPDRVPTTLACHLACEAVRTLGTARLLVFGTSMVPSILPGDLISVRRAELSELYPGEIVVYSREGRLIVHRVVGRAGNANDPRLIARGDRITRDDLPISSSELLGRVISIQCRDGRGYWQIRPAANLSVWERLVVRVLRTSDRATYLYLRLAGYWRGFFSWRTACRA